MKTLRQDNASSEWKVLITTALLVLRPWPQGTRPPWLGAVKATAASVAKTKILLKAILVFSGSQIL